jgi:hypothetical protein
MGKIVANKSLKMDAKQLACAHSSLILANNFAPVSEALGFKQFINNKENPKWIILQAH